MTASDGAAAASQSTSVNASAGAFGVVIEPAAGSARYGTAAPVGSNASGSPANPRPCAVQASTRKRKNSDTPQPQSARRV